MDIFLLFSFCLSKLLLWCSCRSCMMFLWLSYDFFFGAPTVYYAFPMVFLWFPYSFLMQFPHQNLQENLYFGVPGTSFWELFGALGAPWTPSGAKCVLKYSLGCIFCGFWPPFGTVGEAKWTPRAIPSSICRQM